MGGGGADGRLPPARPSRVTLPWRPFYAPRGAGAAGAWSSGGLPGGPEHLVKWEGYPEESSVQSLLLVVHVGAVRAPAPAAGGGVGGGAARS